MSENGKIKNVVIILLGAIVLALAVSFGNTTIILTAFASFIVIIGSNILVKKAVGYYLETDIKTKIWSFYQFGFQRDSHFKSPIPMVWLPLVVSLFTGGIFWWLAIFEFDVEAKPERASKRHGLYRYTEVTEWHMGIIAMWGIIVNLVLAVIAYLIGFEFFAKLSVFYAVWSIIPISSLDGTKIMFASRKLWTIILIVLAIFFAWGVVL